MEIKNISNWHYTSQMEALLFFASLIDEMTFDYTLDSFKASVHNSFSLMRECVETINDIENETIMPAALPPITEEIKDTILRDSILNEMMPSSGLDLLTKKIDANTKYDELKLVLEMFLADSVIQQYNNLLRVELTDLIKKNSNSKEKIEKLSRMFVAQMKFVGYPNASIYKKNKDFFFGKSTKIQDVNAIDTFFSLFDATPQQYSVCLFGNHLFEYLGTALQSVDIEIQHAFDLSAWSPSFVGINKSLKPKDCYIITQVKALDEYHALLRAKNKLTHFTSLFSFYHHKDIFNFVRKEAVIKREMDGACYKIPIPMSVMLVCKDKLPSKAVNVYRRAIKKINLEEYSFERFTKSIKLHDASLQSNHEENQFLNLFTSFEVLMPKAPNSGISRINQISDTMIPYLCHIHFRQIVISFGQDLRLWNKLLFESVIAQIKEGKTEEEKLSALICLDKYDPLRTQIMKDATTNNFFLLRYRLWKLNNKMGTIEHVKSTFFRFEERMRWHINRLYRTRNLIVHAGTHPVYLDMLLENIHSFYDIFMRELLTDITSRKMLKLEYSYLLRRQRYEQYTTYLKGLNNADVIDGSNFLKVLGMQ